jgi:hypothetical protein
MLPIDEVTTSASISGADESVSSSTEVSPTEAPRTTASGPPAGEALRMLDELPVSPEQHATTYNRDEWPHWVTQPDGCSTRERVLIDESSVVPQIDAFGCKVLVGEWLSTYDGEVTEDPGDLEIDHLVALAEAHRSGGWAWDEERKRAFANDLGHPGALRAVTAAANRSKGDKDPAVWQPSGDAAWCGYATDWIEVKHRWGLSVDGAEARALRNMLRSCR